MVALLNGVYMADLITEFSGAILIFFTIVSIFVIIFWGIIYLASKGIAYSSEHSSDEMSILKKAGITRTEILGTYQGELLTHLRYFQKTIIIMPPKARVIIRELIDHPEKHQEEIKFLIDYHLNFAEMLDLIDRSELEDWHIVRSQLYV